MNATITKEDLGLSPQKIKRLLAKLECLNHDTEDCEIYLDFTKEDTDELTTTMIWRLLKNAKSRKHKITVKYRGSTKAFFDERHFFDSLSGRKSSIFSPSVPIHYETFTPTRPSKSDTQNESMDNILNEVTKNILTTENELHKEIKIHMIECINNAFDHSESKPAKPAGIVCSLKDQAYLDFCVADMGQGVKNSFLSNPAFKDEYTKLTDWDIINLATNKNVSCNPVTARNPKYVSSNGGIGLYYLNEFVRLHQQCKIIIISGRGYYYLDSNKKTGKLANIGLRWPGTIVYFRIKTDQLKSQKYKDLVGTKFMEEFDNKPLKVV